MTLNIISAEDTVFTGEVTSVTLPGTKGSFTVLRNHASLISTLSDGKISYVADGNVVELPISGGLVNVDNNVVSVCIY
ncbi:MAG: F0F1 ATP synthase subunit epsilon [Paramuribaculum sp.]|nr:F0F1 ATP synthase subunit epsilon [Paramuribaculum sp.]